VWSLYRTATATGQRPSDLLPVRDGWAAYQFDCAVTFLGHTIEAAAQETQWVGAGDDKHLEPKYQMGQLLDSDFRLPNPQPKEQDGGVAVLKALSGRVRGVRVHKVD